MLGFVIGVVTTIWLLIYLVRRAFGGKKKAARREGEWSRDARKSRLGSRDCCRDCCYTDASDSCCLACYISGPNCYCYPCELCCHRGCDLDCQCCKGGGARSGDCGGLCGCNICDCDCNCCDGGGLIIVFAVIALGLVALGMFVVFWVIFGNVLYGLVLSQSFLRSSVAGRYKVLAYEPEADKQDEAATRDVPQQETMKSTPLPNTIPNGDV